RRCHLTKVLICNGRQSTLFVAVHSRFGRLYVVGGTCFHFDKTQYIFVPANYVDFSPPAWRAKVARHHHVSQAPQVEVRSFLPAPSRPLMHGRNVGRKCVLCHPVQGKNCSLRNSS